MAGRETRPTIAIIGGGLSGALAALHLRRDHPALDTAIVVVEPRARLGAGVAYGTTAPELRVNVSAARMVMFEEDTDHFDRWLRAQDEAARDPAAATPDGALFPRRQRVADYVAEMLSDHDIVHRRGTAIAATPDADGFDILLQDGTRLRADALVLAVSHPPPLLPPVLRAAAAAAPERVVADPWAGQAIAAIPQQARVLVVGSGLTGCDVAASLHGQGHCGPVTLLSRRGLLPHRRTLLPVEPLGDFTTEPARTGSALLRRSRMLAREAAAAGRPWEDVMDAIRRQGQAVWNALPAEEQRRVQRHLRVFWDVHRFQSAPQIDAHLDALRRAGQLEVLAARLLSVTVTARDLSVTLRRRGAATPEERAVDVVVNCTGPGHASVVESNVLLADLARQGALAPDACALGIATAMDGRLLRADGVPWANAYVVGPLARGTYGELMGLPQISFQPRDVAATLATHLAALAPRVTAPA